MRTLLDVLRDMYLDPMDNSPKSLENSRRAVADHIKILEAFRERRSQEIYELMLHHVLEVQRDYWR